MREKETKLTVLGELYLPRCSSFPRRETAWLDREAEVKVIIFQEEKKGGKTLPSPQLSLTSFALPVERSKDLIGDVGYLRANQHWVLSCTSDLLRGSGVKYVFN